MLRSIINKRSIHTIPKLPNIDYLSKHGIPPILSSKGFNTVWNQYQTYLCDKLTIATSGTSLESYFPFHIILNTAKKPFQSNIFNIASATHNNHLFIENILPVDKRSDDENIENRPSDIFLNRIEKSFGQKWDDLKTDILSDVDAKLLGQGWFCLVENSEKQLQILYLQNNGTPYYFPRNQLIDMNSVINFDEFCYLQKIRERINNYKKKGVKDWTLPIIMVNLWDFAYLEDYGVSGRREYMRNVLDNLNWNVINKRLYN